MSKTALSELYIKAMSTYNTACDYSILHADERDKDVITEGKRLWKENSRAWTAYHKEKTHIERILKSQSITFIDRYCLVV
jgi:hypothetical protein